MPSVCVVVPCYNEERRLKVESFQKFLTTNPNIDLLFVNDGSDDGTETIIDQIMSQHPNALKLSFAENGGKAEAVRKGFLHLLLENQYEYIGYLDADLATPFSEFNKLENEIRNRPAVKIILGSRWKRLGSRIERNWVRHYMGRIFATLVSLLFNIDVYDTQCGAKIMHTQNLETIFRDPFVSKWFFDIEILLRLILENPGANMDQWAIEYPLEEWNEIGNSRIKLKDFISVPLQLMRIRSRYRK